MKRWRRTSVIAIVVLLASASSAQTWRAMGPPGGDVRALAIDPANPQKIYLGTTDGHIFISQDAGEHWKLAGRAGPRQDSVVTAIVVNAKNPQRILASTWTRDEAQGGGVFLSEDGGLTWRASGLVGHAVRALAGAPSNENVFVAGALDGVFRSLDGGATWQRISPEGHAELRNLDSIAIDPREPDTIYAGTFHLPWKTTDGGKTWSAVHSGMIDDSDVMSIAIDRNNHSRILASACSGIYLSEDAAAQWRKVQGIPYSARRTLAILQDPQKPATVYAGTTEGLWRTTTSGAAWSRITPVNWVINSVSVVPRENSSSRILIGTEQFGVLLSDDGGKQFRESNRGFNHRQIVALALDRIKPDRVLAVLANAIDPIVATSNGGQTWAPLGPGLSSRAVKQIYAAPTGWWASLAQGGLMRYDAKRNAWIVAGKLSDATAIALRDVRVEKRGSTPRNSRAAGNNFEEAVNDMAFSGKRCYAATDRGLLLSEDLGATWDLLPLGVMPTLPVRSVRASPDGQNLWIVSLRGLVFSRDAGKTWSWHDLPLSSGGAKWLDSPATAANSGFADPDSDPIYAAAENGLYISRDGGASWKRAGSGLPQLPLQDLAVAGDIALASVRGGGLYLSRDAGKNWERVNGEFAGSSFPVVIAQAGAANIFAASATDGLFEIELGPVMARDAAQQ